MNEGRDGRQGKKARKVTKERMEGRVKGVKKERTKLGRHRIITIEASQGMTCELGYSALQDVVTTAKQINISECQYVLNVSRDPNCYEKSR